MSWDRERKLEEKLNAMIDGVRRQLDKAEYYIGQDLNSDLNKILLKEMCEDLAKLCNDPLGEKK